MQMIVDNRSGVHNQDLEVGKVDSEVAICWLRKLDGKRHTLLSLDRTADSRLMVGGGPSWFIVTLDNGKLSLTLQNLTNPACDTIELCAGGQYGEYPKLLCVNEEQAAQMIRQFFLGNEMQAKWT